MKPVLVCLLPVLMFGAAVCPVFGAGPWSIIGQDPPRVERARQLVRKAQSGETLTPEERAFLDSVRQDTQRMADGKNDAGNMQGPASNGPPIDVQLGRSLMERSQRGKGLSPEDQAYLGWVKAEIRRRAEAGKQREAPPAAAPAANPDDWKDLVPISEMMRPYKGEDGGLDGSGRDEPPEGHRQAHLEVTREIVPRDEAGRPAANGKIGLISIGFSNPSIEWEHFKRIADSDPEKSPLVVIVNGCIWGRSAVMWAWDGADMLSRAELERLDKAMDLLKMPNEAPPQTDEM